MTRLIHLGLASLLIAIPACAPPSHNPVPYVTAAQVDLLLLLPPPPAPNSPQAAAELAESIALDHDRTPERAAQATRDANETVLVMFGSTLGPRFTPDALPRAMALFDRLAETEEAVTDPIKTRYARPRPFMIDPNLHPVAPKTRSGSYPSGHTTLVTMIGIVLAAMVPEHQAAIFARAQDYADSRVIAGVHFRTDVVAGRQAGTAVDAVLFNDPAFTAEFGPARAELRAALGLP